jgi:hypothetical protein
MRRTMLALIVCLLGACGGGPERRPGDPPGSEPEPAAGRVGAYVDEECFLQARSVRVVLPRSLRGECSVDALVGGWKGLEYRGRGHVDFRLRGLRVVADDIEIRVADGPPGTLRVQAEGDAKILAGALERTDPPAETILLRPDRVLID